MKSVHILYTKLLRLRLWICRLPAERRASHKHPLKNVGFPCVFAASFLQTSSPSSWMLGSGRRQNSCRIMRFHYKILQIPHIFPYPNPIPASAAPALAGAAAAAAAAPSERPVSPAPQPSVQNCQVRPDQDPTFSGGYFAVK